ncbi:MAG: (Fe-S)-binding protein [Dehalococcoidia bacterium]|nr:(Fe-S)-binding protein [Dehalococcoidia bacterium]MCB9485595.1 (Fe-S)-binding protein [Thermoflexaceae bacterium]
MVRVGLFDPCYLGALRPSDAAHARRVLETLGDDVVLIDGRCCGQPAFNSGFRNEARKVGLEFLRAAREFDVVVTASGSCTSMVQHYLPGLFSGTKAGGAAKIAERVHEFTSYVAGHPQLESVIFRLAGVVAYHDSCHYRRELRSTQTALGLLARVEGLEVRRLTHEAECCGFGGAFSAKLPEVSGEMLKAKLEDIEATGAHVVVSTDFSCLAHMETGDRARGGEMETWTIAELLARALG